MCQHVTGGSLCWYPTLSRTALTPPHRHRHCSNLVFLKRYNGDVAALNLTFTITDNVLGATREVGGAGEPCRWEGRRARSMAVGELRARCLLCLFPPTLPHHTLCLLAGPAGGPGTSRARGGGERRQPSGLHPPRGRLPPEPADPGARGCVPAVRGGQRCVRQAGRRRGVTRPCSLARPSYPPTCPTGTGACTT